MYWKLHSGLAGAFSSMINKPSSQPVLIGEDASAPEHLCGPPLCCSNRPMAFLCWELQRRIQHSKWGSHQSRTDRKHPLPCPAGQTTLDAAQNIIGFLDCKSIFLGHVQVFSHTTPMSFLGLLSIHSSFSTRVWDCPDLGAATCTWPCWSVSGSCGSLLWMATCTSVSPALFSFCHLQTCEGALDPLSGSLIKILKGSGPKTALRDTTHHQLPPRHRVIDWNSLALSSQSFPYPWSKSPFRPISLQSGDQEVVCDCVKGLQKAR